MISHRAKKVTVENNIFVDGENSQAYFYLAGEMSDVRVRRNIFSWSSPSADFVRLLIAPGASLCQTLAEFDSNLIFSASKSLVSVCGLAEEPYDDAGIELSRGDRSFASWQDAGYDSHSVLADPLFVDPSAGDYRLSPQSPAFGLGFEQIDVSRIGLSRSHHQRHAKGKPGDR